MFKSAGSSIWRLGTRTALRKYSSSSLTATEISKEINKDIKQTTEDTERNYKKSSGLIATTFLQLNTLQNEDTKKPSPKTAKLNQSQQIDQDIWNAKDLDSLLVLINRPEMSRRHALMVMSLLSQWTKNKKIALSDFESDPRFLKLCRIFSKNSSPSASGSDSLGTVMSITADDEAARMINDLNLPQMIKVMKVLQQKGSRRTPLLRSISHNINKLPEVINLKNTADLLYVMASLHFPDPMLLDRLCKDVITSLATHADKPAVVNSIIVSLGIMRYRHEAVLTAIVEWLQKYEDLLKSDDIASTIVTLATVNFIPDNSESIFKRALAIKEEELSKSILWLDLVFSLLILNKAQDRHLASTLKPNFIDRLFSFGEISISSRRKLMVIDSYVSLMTPNHSPRLPEDITVGVPIVYTKEKMFYVQRVMETFKSYISADAFIKRNCNSGMGFLYDAEFAIDAKCHPVPLEKAAQNKSIFRIALLCLDYHDMTRNTIVPLGAYQLYSRLLQLKGFRVLHIPYTEFNPSQNLVTKVKYIERQLKDIVSKKSNHV